MHVCVLSHFNHVQLCATPWIVARQSPLSMGFSKQEYQSGVPCPPPGDLSDPGTEPMSPAAPALQADSLPLSHWGQPGQKICTYNWFYKFLFPTEGSNLEVNLNTNKVTLCEISQSLQDLPKCISISRKVKRKTHLEKMLISLKSVCACVCVCVCVCVRERERETEREREMKQLKRLQ